MTCIVSLLSKENQEVLTLTSMTVPDLRKSLSFIPHRLSPKDRRETARHLIRPVLAISPQILPLMLPDSTFLITKTAVQYISTVNHSSVSPAKIVCRQQRAIHEAML